MKKHPAVHCRSVAQHLHCSNTYNSTHIGRCHLSPPQAISACYQWRTTLNKHNIALQAHTYLNVKEKVEVQMNGYGDEATLELDL